MRCKNYFEFCRKIFLRLVQLLLCVQPDNQNRKINKYLNQIFQLQIAKIAISHSKCLFTFSRLLKWYRWLKRLCMVHIVIRYSVTCILYSNFYTKYLKVVCMQHTYINCTLWIFFQSVLNLEPSWSALILGLSQRILKKNYFNVRTWYLWY